jgi:hypothetical protein
VVVEQEEGRLLLLLSVRHGEVKSKDLKEAAGNLLPLKKTVLDISVRVVVQVHKLKWNKRKLEVAREGLGRFVALRWQPDRRS